MSQVVSSIKKEDVWAPSLISAERWVGNASFSPLTTEELLTRVRLHASVCLQSLHLGRMNITICNHLQGIVSWTLLPTGFSISYYISK